MRKICVLLVVLSCCVFLDVNGLSKEDFLYKQVVSYKYNNKFSTLEDANKQKVIEEEKQDIVKKDILETNGVYDYNVKVDKVIDEQKELLFDSYEDYEINVLDLKNKYKNILFVINVNETFDNMDNVNKYKSDLEELGFSVLVDTHSNKELKTSYLDNVYETKVLAQNACNVFVKDSLSYECTIVDIIDKTEIVSSDTKKSYFDSKELAESTKNEEVNKSTDKINITGSVSADKVMVLSDKESIEKIFATEELANAYVNQLVSDGYIISDKSIVEVNTSAEVVVPGGTTGSIGSGQSSTQTWGHLDVLVNNEVVLIDSLGGTSKVNGEISLTSVKVDGDVIRMNGKSIDPNTRLAEYTSKNRNLKLNNNSFIEIIGVVSYKENNVNKTADFKINGYLNESNNKCGGRGSSRGFDLKFESITISDDRVIVDTNVKAYKLSANKQSKLYKYELVLTTTSYGSDYDLSAFRKDNVIKNYTLDGVIKQEYKVFDYVVIGSGEGYKLYGDVVVRYVDLNGKELINSDYLYGEVNDSYETSPSDLKDINYVYTGKYKVDKNNLDKDGKFINDRITVTYIYKYLESENPVKRLSVNTGIDSKGNGYLIYSISCCALLGVVLFLRKKKSN